MSTKHTGGTWSVSKKGGAVVSTDEIPGLPDYRTGHADVYYYGGYLIAESIWNPADARVIAAAPDLLGCAHDFMEVLTERGMLCECGQEDCRTSRLRAAILKATGERP